MTYAGVWTEPKPAQGWRDRGQDWRRGSQGWRNRAQGWRSREAARARIEALTWLLDKAFRLPGTSFRIGVDGLVGLVPGVGDFITSTLALWLVFEAYMLGAPAHVIARMLANVALDTTVGSIPIVGDLFDFAFKANVRNRDILRRHMGI